MLPSFKKLHYSKNWFTALFHMMSRVVLEGETKQPLFFFKMTWGSALQIYKDQSQQVMLMECKWKGRSGGLMGLQSWDVFEGTKQVGLMKMELMKSLLSMGTEQWSMFDASGKEMLKMKAASDAALKHVLDNVIGEYYNPTHVYTIEDMKGGVVATLSMKHGIFRSFYDLSFEKGSESERAMVLGLFAAILLMLKK